MKYLSALLLAGIVSIASGCDTNTTQPVLTASNNGYIMNSTALLFDGGSAMVTVPDDASLYLSDGSFTFEAWIKVGATGRQQWIVTKRSTPTTIDYALGLNKDDHFVFQANNIQTWFEDKSTIVTTGRYFHVAIAFDRTIDKATLYVDGVPTASATINGGGVDVDNRLILGGSDVTSTSGPENWDGLIYNASFWNIARSQTDITQSIFQKPGGTENNLVACWTFDDGNGTLVRDRTGRHNGTINGNATWVAMPY